MIFTLPETPKAPPEEKKPLLTVLNFSGGKQSSALLWMVLRGEITPKGQFVVMNADPGMEDSRTYIYVAEMKQRCLDAGIEFITAKGPNLFDDLLNMEGKKRIDTPPFYVTNPQGKTGKLMQQCTAVYKIAPMDRQLRMILHRDFGINPKGTPPVRSVEKWIGFHAGEWHRVSESGKKYTYFRFPLIEMNMDDAQVAGYFLKNNLPKPPRSVCNACFANSIPYFRDMHTNRKQDWEKAVAVDDAIRHGIPNVKGEAFVLRYRVPLKDLPSMGWKPEGYDPEKDKEQNCNFGGYCFV